MEIKDFYEHVKPRVFEERLRNKLVDDLNHLLSVRGRWQDRKMYPFGSFMSGLYLPTGDMDLVFCSTVFANGGPPRSFATNQHNQLVRLLQSEGVAVNNRVESIRKARVPLAKYVDRTTGLKVDISFENTGGLVAIGTFKAWKEQYPVMPVLVTVIKQFLLMRGLNEPVNGGIGGFSVICMVVSMLQLMPPVQSGDMVPEHHLGSLLMHFFDLYGNRFDYNTTALRLNPPGYVNKVRHAHANLLQALTLYRETEPSQRLHVQESKTFVYHRPKQSGQRHCWRIGQLCTNRDLLFTGTQAPQGAIVAHIQRRELRKHSRCHFRRRLFHVPRATKASATTSSQSFRLLRRVANMLPYQDCPLSYRAFHENRTLVRDVFGVGLEGDGISAILLEGIKAEQGHSDSTFRLSAAFPSGFGIPDEQHTCSANAGLLLRLVPCPLSPKDRFCEFELNSGRSLYDRSRDVWPAPCVATNVYDVQLVAGLDVYVTRCYGRDSRHCRQQMTQADVSDPDPLDLEIFFSRLLFYSHSSRPFDGCVKASTTDSSQNCLVLVQRACIIATFCDRLRMECSIEGWHILRPFLPAVQTRTQTMNTLTKPPAVDSCYHQLVGSSPLFLTADWT